MAKSLRILSPRDGDVLNRHDGQLSAEALVVPVTGTTPFGAPVTANGIPGDVVDETFTCAVALRQGEEAIEACAGDVATRISVLCDYNSQPRYRFSVDDNIEWLADLAQHPDEFDSLFDHWFLAFWQQLHREYNTKVHFNLYYQTVDQRFNLSQFPEKWRDDFEQNSDWLHLSFHALQDKPDRIYKDATYDQLAHDFELVMDEIERFAGEAVTSRVMTVHWAEAPREACRPSLTGVWTYLSVCLDQWVASTPPDTIWICLSPSISVRATPGRITRRALSLWPVTRWLIPSALRR